MAIFTLTYPQLLLCPFALGNVDHSTDEFNQITRRTENRMTSAANVPDSPTRMHDSIFSFNVHLLKDGLPGDFQELHLIVGMNPLGEFFDSRQTIPWIKTQNAVAFLRPIPDVGVGTPCPTARVAQFLRLCQISLTLP